MQGLKGAHMRPANVAAAAQGAWTSHGVQSLHPIWGVHGSPPCRSNTVQNVAQMAPWTDVALPRGRHQSFRCTAYSPTPAASTQQTCPTHSISVRQQHGVGDGGGGVRLKRKQQAFEAAAQQPGRAAVSARPSGPAPPTAEHEPVPGGRCCTTCPPQSKRIL